MALSFIGSANGTTSVTMPTHRVGDILIGFAFRDGSTTNPTIPTGWTNVTNTTDGTSCSLSIGYKIAASSSETSGTWTSASRMIVLCYRGQKQDTSATPLGTIAATAGTTNTLTYTSRTLAASNVTGSSWFIAFAGHRSVDQALETPPTGMTLRDSSVDATCEVAAFDTNGPATADWPSTNVALAGTASGWQTVVVELKSWGSGMNNYQFARTTPNTTGANAGVISFGERIR